MISLNEKEYIEVIYNIYSHFLSRGMAWGGRVWEIQCFLYTLSKLSEIIHTNNNTVNSGKY